MADSIHDKIARVRAPRVNISYDVEKGNAIQQVSLPFVMGILGDFTGMPVEPLARVRDRKFVEVSKDNFDSVLASMKPHLAFTVDNKLAADNSTDKLGVDLTFKSLSDFSPEAVAKQVKPLNDLLNLRNSLSNLRAQLQTNEKLDDVLQATMHDSDKLAALKAELGLDSQES